MKPTKLTPAPSSGHAKAPAPRWERPARRAQNSSSREFTEQTIEVERLDDGDDLTSGRWLPMFVP